MKRTFYTFLRMIRTGWVLARHDALVPSEYTKSVPAVARVLGSLSRIFTLRNLSVNPGERLALALEKLGPAYIKFGQILSTRGDMLDPVFVEGLSRLKDKVPPFSMKAAEDIILKEWGVKWQDKLSTFSQPIAAASIAQVHKATLQSGEVVAIKILRPNIHKRMRNDMDVLHMVAAIAENLIPSSKRLGHKKFVETADRAVMLELDLRLEAAAASELSELPKKQGYLMSQKFTGTMAAKIF